MPQNYINVLKRQEYVSHMRPVFNKRGVFSDETEQYRTPFQPKAGDDVKIRIRTLKNNVDKVYLISGALRQEMELEERRGSFDYYATTIHVEKEVVRYYFELQIEELRCYYNQLGVTRDLKEYYSFMISPDFSVPEWSRGAVMYQVFVDRFYNGDKTNDVETREYS